VHYLNGTDSGSDVYLGGKCKGGFGDLRFTAMDGVTLLPYWMETPISDNATFWVKVSDNLTAQSAIIYLYYGNPAANSTSNGTATFDFYDDFSADTGWTLSGANIDCGVLNLEPSQYASHYAEKDRYPFSSSNYRFRFREATSETTQYWQAYPRKTGTYPDNSPRLKVGPYAGDTCWDTRYITAGGPYTPDFNPSPPSGEDAHVIEVLNGKSSSGGSGGFTVTWDDRLFSSIDDATAETGDKVAFCTCGTFNMPLQIDWVFLAKYWVDPVEGNWGPEEGTGTAAPSPAAVLFWGTQDYSEYNYNLTGGYPEKLISYQLSEDAIKQLFEPDGRYGYCANYWGSSTQPDFVDYTARYCEEKYASTVIFYKGHSWEDNYNGIKHYGVYDSEGNGISGYNVSKHDYIKDYNLYGNVTLGMAAAGKSEGTHDLVFLWTCGQGSDNHTGTINTGDPWGMLSCWMHVDANSTMGRDGYALNETNTSGRCFIGFDYLSKWFTDGTGFNQASYGQFSYLFFQYALQGYSVRDSLNRATHDVRNVDHLYDWAMPAPDLGYFYKPPGYQIMDYHANPPQLAWSRIRIWGDGDTVIPHS
jgi:hypothetical protein